MNRDKIENINFGSVYAVRDTNDKAYQRVAIVQEVKSGKARILNVDTYTISGEFETPVDAVVGLLNTYDCVQPSTGGGGLAVSCGFGPGITMDDVRQYAQLREREGGQA